MEMKVSLLMVGDELLIGQVVDTNATWLAQALWQLGIPVVSKITCGDDMDDIVAAIHASFEKGEWVIMTGGLGPTKDDVTKKAIASFFNTELKFHQETYDRIKSYFNALKRPLNELHKEQSFMPENGEIIQNELGTAPAMLFEFGNKRLVSLPGVPYEMKDLFDREIQRRIKAAIPESPYFYSTLRTIGIGESDLSARIDELPVDWDRDISLAYLPDMAQVRLRISAKGVNNKDAMEKVAKARLILKDKLGRWVYGEDNDSLEIVVGRLLLREKKFLVTAESCTGGLIAHSITKVPGASSYFKGSVIAYSNEVKESLLKVPAQTLKDHGAVSEQTVIAMVRGALITLNADIAVAVSGIAGPDGGSEKKPVGLIYIACGDANNVKVTMLQLNKDRQQNVAYASVAALNMIRKFLLGL
jgi:nicotinamide-nucleotide amidase